MSAKSAKEKIRDLSEIANMLNDGLKKKVFIADPSKLLSHVSEWLPTGSLLIDLATGGGIPLGRVIEIYGRPDVGKSTLAQSILVQLYKRGGLGVYIDSENALDEKRCRDLGLNLSDVLHCRVDTIEEGFELISFSLDKLRSSKIVEPIVYVWDTMVRNMTRSSFEGRGGIGSRSKAVREGITVKLANALPVGKASLIVLNHAVMHGITTGIPYVGSSGTAPLQHEASLRLRMSSGNPRRIENKDKVEIGQVSKVLVEESNVCVPKREVSIRIMFKTGIDDEGSNFDFLVHNNVLKQSGGWYTMQVGKKELKFRASDFREAITEANAWNEFHNLVRETFSSVYPDI